MLPKQIEQGIRMGKISLVLATISMVAMAACGSKTDANEKNFGAAISKAMAKDPDVCLAPQIWPVEVPVVAPRLNPGATRNAPQLAALESVGLLSSEDVEVDEPGFFGKSTRTRMKRYMPTLSAKPYYRQKEMVNVTANGGGEKVKGGKLCWAQGSLDKVVKWDLPTKLGDAQETTVAFTYKLANIADWAKKPEVQSAFPEVKKMIDGAGTVQVTTPVKLTSEGWESVR